jgi:hypothetical protein
MCAMLERMEENQLPKVLIFNVLLTLSIAVAAQNPVPRTGNSCPSGTYRFGDYCKPTKPNSDQVIA